MGKPRFLAIILMAFFVMVESIPTVRRKTTTPTPCESGPKFYCETPERIEECDVARECEEYAQLSPCLKEPEDYCKTPEIAESCQKTAFCMTWPNDDVTATYMFSNPSITGPSVADPQLDLELPLSDFGF